MCRYPTRAWECFLRNVQTGSESRLLSFSMGTGCSENKATGGSSGPPANIYVDTKVEWRYSTVQYSTVQYSTIQYSTVQYSTVQYSTVQYSTVQYSAVQCCTVQYSTVQNSTHLHTNNTQNNTINFGRVLAMPCLCDLYPGICLKSTENPQSG